MELKLNEKFREWRDWPVCLTDAASIPHNIERLHFYREKKSHRGIRKHKSLKELVAKQVDQNFLHEICDLYNLEYLEMETVTATDISILKKLPKLRYLKIYGLRNAKDISCLTKMENLRKLFLENIKHLSDLNFLDGNQKLKALGVEGSMYTKQKIASLEPISRVKSLEAVFLSSVQLTDKNLDYLALLPQLMFLYCARFAPKSSFESLRALMPNLICNWCDKYKPELLEHVTIVELT
jgi:hypothetical protein